MLDSSLRLARHASGHHDASRALPLVLTPPSEAAAREPVSWLVANLPELRAQLLTAGALLLRGFDVARPQTFAALAEQFAGPLGEDYRGPSPRHGVGEGVYTASEVPSALVIPEHAEMSYLPHMPRTLFFWCRRPSARGGATTLVDARRVLGRLDPARVEPLIAGPLRIRRRHAARARRLDPFELKPWPTLLGTHDRDAALHAAESQGFTATFEPSGALTLESEQPAVRTHPVTGERAWLNHLLVYHASAPAALLESAIRVEHELGALASYPLAVGYRWLAARLRRPVATDVLAHTGEPISDACVAHVREVVDGEAVHLAWQAGDVAVVDNHRVLHGRRPFRGQRQVAVAWSEASA